MIGIFSKIVWPNVRKNCFGDQEKLLKFEGDDQEFAKCLKLIEKNIRTVKGQ